MIKYLNKKLIAGAIAAGMFFTLSGTKMGDTVNYEAEASTATNIVVDDEISHENISLEENIIESVVEEVEEDNNLIPVVRATTPVNVRSESNTDGDIYGVLEEGDTLQYDTKLDNGWYKVNYNNSVGYVCGDYLEESFIINKDVLFNVYVNNETNIYDDKDEIIGTLPYLEFAKVYDEDENRYFVESEGKIGYIDKENTSKLEGDYVVVDISRQNLRLYHDKEEVLSTSVVTGKDSTPSDIGLFDIDFMTTNTVLRGDNYASPVSYWMPYNGGEGLHDATWRSYFGGDIYHDNGSHGCINMPLDMAEEVYSHVNVGDKVLVKE